MHLRDAARLRLIVHSGNVRQTLFFFCSALGVCVWGILRGNVDMLRRGGGCFDLAGSELRKAQRCVSNWLGVRNSKQQHSSIKERLAPGSTELQPPWSPLSNTDRKHSAGLPGQESRRMSTFSEEDEKEEQIKSFVWRKDASSLSFLQCGSPLSFSSQYFLWSFHLSSPSRLLSPISPSAISPVSSSQCPFPFHTSLPTFNSFFFIRLSSTYSCHWKGGSHRRVGAEESNEPFEGCLAASPE